MIYSFVFELEAVSKERPRFSIRGGIPRTYTAPKTRKFEDSIAALARKQMGSVPMMKGTIKATAIFYFKTPKKTSLQTPKKDLDNLCKSVFDALNEVAYYDDTQINHLIAFKHWHTKDCITVTLENQAEKGD